MSSVAADVLDRSPYQAPEADLVNHDEATPDKLFSAEGRIGIWRYNTRVLQGLFVMGIGGVLLFAGIFAQEEPGIVAMLAAIPALVLMIGAAAMLVYSAIKRLHDLNYSGWYYLISLIPLVGVIWSLYYAVKPGAEDANRFGAPREATKADKIMGVMGITLTVLLTILNFVPMGS